MVGRAPLFRVRRARRRNWSCGTRRWRFFERSHLRSTTFSRINLASILHIRWGVVWGSILLNWYIGICNIFVHFHSWGHEFDLVDREDPQSDDADSSNRNREPQNEFRNILIWVPGTGFSALPTRQLNSSCPSRPSFTSPRWVFQLAPPPSHATNASKSSFAKSRRSVPARLVLPHPLQPKRKPSHPLPRKFVYLKWSQFHCLHQNLPQLPHPYHRSTSFSHLRQTSLPLLLRQSHWKTLSLLLRSFVSPTNPKSHRRSMSKTWVQAQKWP